MSDGEAAMKYSKPEIVELGDAASVIEQTGKKSVWPADPAHNSGVVNPAYEPDE